jgi:hypothetical protein
MTAMSAQSASAIDAANPFPDLPAIRGPDASPQPPQPRGPAPRPYPRPRFGDYSRTRFELRSVFGWLHPMYYLFRGLSRLTAGATR